jgi:hypothetical protein
MGWIQTHIAGPADVQVPFITWNGMSHQPFFFLSFTESSDVSVLPTMSLPGNKQCKEADQRRRGVNSTCIVYCISELIFQKKLDCHFSKFEIVSPSCNTKHPNIFKTDYLIPYLIVILLIP